ncbi:rhomboid family intramembrane serine protease [Jeotgalibacillus sp. ET6]|uniref:rhomboid family intramembrane serine protease n=1 Tax=Jeotgalibacillus sp. ET6 TaxID=3037260 RepID=UPI0024181EBC|nr:rhomboid family intramembrane serine protease [Jeotgalibacillus sp. ET6]MDG5472440.1 rhomboid family intramembrane serine protease [Jeotgalibacillus sp. ET6]
MLIVKRKQFEFIKTIPVTMSFILIYIIFTLCALLLGGYDEEVRIRLGAYDQQLVREGQVWRLFTYSLGHMSLFHLIINLPFMFFFARPLEEMMGSFKFMVSCISLSIFAGLIIYLFSDYPSPLAGSSGLGFGFLGVFLVLLFLRPEYFTTHQKAMISLFIILAFAGTFFIADISKAGHIGGFIGGIILSIFFLRTRLLLKRNSETEAFQR